MADIQLVTKIVTKKVPWPKGWTLIEGEPESYIQEEVMNAVSEAIMEDVSQEAEPDLIVEVCAKIEGMDQSELEQHIPSLIAEVDFTYFELGLALSRYAEEGWWKDGYDSFRDSIEDKFGVQYRKAMYLMGISKNLLNADIPYSKVANIGWSKLKEISSILTAENVDEWVEKIEGPPPMTLFQIQEAVKAISVNSLPSSEVPEIEDKIVSMAFKVHPDQKENIRAALDKAKGEAGTEFDAVALDAICMNYMSGGNVKPKTLAALFKGYNPEDVLEAFDVVWPEIDVTAKM